MAKTALELQNIGLNAKYSKQNTKYLLISSLCHSADIQSSSMESQAEETLESGCHVHSATTEAQLLGEYHTNSTAKLYQASVWD